MASLPHQEGSPWLGQRELPVPMVGTGVGRCLPSEVSGLANGGVELPFFVSKLSEGSQGSGGHWLFFLLTDP